MSLPGLPPLPKSLSGFDLTAAQQRLYQNDCLGGGLKTTTASTRGTPTTATSTPNSNNPSSAEDSATASAQLQEISPLDSRKSKLDTQLDILRREMVSSSSLSFFNFFLIPQPNLKSSASSAIATGSFAFFAHLRNCGKM